MVTLVVEREEGRTVKAAATPPSRLTGHALGSEGVPFVCGQRVGLGLYVTYGLCHSVGWRSPNLWVHSAVPHREKRAVCRPD